MIILSRLIAVAKYSNDAAQQGRTESIHTQGVSVPIKSGVKPKFVTIPFVYYVVQNGSTRNW